MRFLWRNARYNDKVGTKDFIIIVIYIVKFSSMTLTVSKAFIYIYKVLNVNYPNSSAFILFCLPFLQPSYALKLMSCHSSQQTTTEDLSHGLGWRWSSKWWNVLTFCYFKISRFRHHRKCSTWASKKKKVLHTLLCTIPRFIVCQCIFLHTFEYVEHHSWQGIHFNGEWAAWKWYVKIFFVCMNPLSIVEISLWRKKFHHHPSRNGKFKFSYFQFAWDFRASHRHTHTTNSYFFLCFMLAWSWCFHVCYDNENK